jgi:hypothetical protein
VWSAPRIFMGKLRRIMPANVFAEHTRQFSSLWQVPVRIPPFALLPVCSSLGRSHGPRIGYSSQTPVNRGDAPIALTLAGNEKENKTIKHRQFTPIQYGPESTWRMRLEVGDCHFSAGDECGNGGEEPDRNQNSSSKFDDPGRKTLRVMNLTLSAQDTEELLRSVTSEEETNNEPHQAVRDRAVSLEH